MIDTSIPKQTKKMLLFASPYNSILLSALGVKAISQNMIATTIGVSHATIPGWKNGANVDPTTAQGVFSKVQSLIRKSALNAEAKAAADDALRRFIENFDNDDAHVYGVADVLGMAIEDCQKVIDEVVYKRSPIFPRMYYETKAIADEYFQQYKGTYRLFVKRDATWLLCPLRVRYIIDVPGGFLIRCKLNLPLIEHESGVPFWEYDGFLVRRPNRAFWMFEKRQRDRNDQFYFITDTGRSYASLEDPSRRTRTMVGEYLTVGQDEYQSIVSSKLIMQRIDTDDDQARVAFMHGSARTLNAEESASVDKLVADHQNTSRPR